MVQPIEVDVVGNVADLGRALRTGQADVRSFASNVGKSSAGDFKRSGASAGDGFVGGIKSRVSGAGAVFKGALGAGAVGAALGAASEGFSQLTGVVKESVSEARESQKVGATTAQIIKQTGGAAKISADGVGALATSISNKTGIDDEAIQSGANLLLTFKNVKNEAGDGANVFDRATAAATDLSAAGFGSIEGSSKMLGKALNDPIKGISALGRAGVTFTDQQKEQIATLVKSGDTLGAQKIIMGEVESQVGGVAEASATAGEKFATMTGNLKEQFGTILLPYLDKFETFFTSTIGPAISKGLGQLGPIIENVVKAVGPVLSTVFGVIKQIAGQIQAAFAGGGGASGFVSQLAPIGAAVKNILGLVGPLIGQIIGTVVSLMPVLAGIFGAVVGVVQKVAPIIVQVVGAILGAIKENMPAIQSAVTTIGQALSTVGEIIGTVWGALAPVLLPIIKVVFGTIVQVISGAVKIVAGVLKVVSSILKGDWAGAWQGAKQVVAGVVQIVVGILRGMSQQVSVVMGAIKGALASAWASIKSTVAGAWNGIVSTVKGKASDVVATAKAIPGKIKSALGNLGSVLLGAGRKLIDGLVSGIKDRIRAAVDAVRAGVQKIKNLLPGSPIKEGPLKSWNNGGAGKRLMGLLQGGIESGTPGVRSSLAGALKAGASVKVRTAGAGAAAGGNVYHLTVNVPPTADRVAIGREIQEALSEFERAGGRKRAS